MFLQLPTIQINWTTPEFSTLINFDVDEFEQGNNILPWNCKGCEFIDKLDKYILISNLKIISDNKLKTLLTKEPKYQKEKTISFQKAKLDFIAGLNKPIDAWFTEHSHEKNIHWMKIKHNLKIRF